MGSFIKKAGKLLGAIFRIPLHFQIGTSPAFELERKQWLEKSNRESILSEFAKFLLCGKPDRRAVFNSVEIASLKKAFAAHANPDNYWDRQSLESYLLTRIPDDKECRFLLTSCLSSLWTVVTHFSQWPFSTTPSETLAPASLTFPDLVRALAFLSGRHSLIFSYWTGEDENKIPERTDALVLEQIFQAMATTRSLEQAPDAALPDPVEANTASQQWDLLHLLNTIQPILDEWTDPLYHDELVPLAIRLSTPAPRGLSSLRMSYSEGLAPLLDLSISLLQHASKFDTTSTPGLLIKDLEAARINLQQVECISFDEFTKWLGGDNANIYDALALLFNTFTSPNSLRDGIMINFMTEKKVNLFLESLRNPGFSLVST